MTYRVLIPQEVADAVDAQAAYLRQRLAPENLIEGWLLGLVELIESLSERPRRFPVAEAVSAAKGYEVRRVNYGDSAVFYRVDEEQRAVEILAFRHGRRRPWLEGEG